MSEDRALTVLEPGTLVQRSPMDMLAEMSEDEFTHRLDSLKAAQRRMERIQRELMDADIDYGVIPGTGTGTGTKPTLLKPGAEKLCKFHHLVAVFEEQTILGDGIHTPDIRIASKCSLHYESDQGPIVGQGQGAANSWEKKYRWREAKRQCPTCGAAAIFRSKYPDKQTQELGWYCYAKVGGCGATFGEHDPNITGQQQGQAENPDPFDVENTLIKMSAKRSYVDATLRTTATSGLFSQDLEDLPETPTQAQPPMPEPHQAPSRSASSAPTATPAKAQTAVPTTKRAVSCTQCQEPIVDVDKYRASWIIDSCKKYLGQPYCLAHYQDAMRRRQDLIGAYGDLYSRARELGIEPGILGADALLSKIEAMTAYLQQQIQNVEATIPAPGSAEAFEQEEANI